MINGYMETEDPIINQYQGGFRESIRDSRGDSFGVLLYPYLTSSSPNSISKSYDTSVRHTIRDD